MCAASEKIKFQVTETLFDTLSLFAVAQSSPCSFLQPNFTFLFSPGGDIFAFEKLLIPINLTHNHFFVICVFMKSRTIQVLDSMPDDTGRASHLNRIKLYLEEEHQAIHKNRDKRSWKLKRSFGRDSVPRQSATTNDCGVFTCLFMDFLLLNLPLEALTQTCIARHGREWLCKCIIDKAIVF